MGNQGPMIMPRAAVCCRECNETAVLKLQITATKAEVNAAACAAHARMSPDCRARTLSVKYFDLSLN
jgi:hypothetical protein